VVVGSENGELSVEEEIRQEIRKAETLWGLHRKVVSSTSPSRMHLKPIRWDLPVYTPQTRFPARSLSELNWSVEDEIKLPWGGYLIHAELELETLVDLAGSYCQP